MLTARALMARIWRMTGVALLWLLAMNAVAAVFVVATGIGNSFPQGADADGYFGAKWPKEYYTELSKLKLRWHPYSYFIFEPFTGKYINIDKNGLRRTWNSNGMYLNHRKKVFKIFAFGASPMFGHGAADDDTIPSLLAKALAKDGVDGVEVTNFGQSGYVSTQEVLRLFEQLRVNNIPDLVIFYDGAADTFSAFQSGVAGIPMNEFERQREFNLLNFHQPERVRALYRSAISMLIVNSAITRVLMAGLRTVSRQTYYKLFNIVPVLTPYSANISGDLPGSVAEEYKQNIWLVRETGKHVGFKSLFYWQPAVFTKTPLSNYERNRESERPAGEKEFYCATRDKVRAMAERNIGDGDGALRDLSDALNGLGKPCFVDAYHMTGTCNQVIAHLMEKDVLRLIPRTSNAVGVSKRDP